MAPLVAALALGMVSPAWAEAETHGSSTATATAKATRQAKVHFRAGARLYRQARYREAISEFEAAYRARPHGVILYNLARCHERLRNIPGALRAYHEYLRAMPGAADRRRVRATMAKLERRLAAFGLQQVLVYTDPPGAEVKVDGRARGSTPFAALFSPGAHALSLSKPGFETLERQVALAGRSLVVDVPLQRAGPPAVAAAPSPSLAPTPPREAPGAPTVSLTAPGPKKSPAHRPRVFTWVAAGVAAGTLAAGIAYGLAARNASDDLRRTEHGSPEAQRLADSASSRARTANILYGVAGAAGAVGVTLFFVEGHF
jgi:tetratricopeptide (TPR) repeat protein